VEEWRRQIGRLEEEDLLLTKRLTGDLVMDVYGDLSAKIKSMATTMVDVVEKEAAMMGTDLEIQRLRGAADTLVEFGLHMDTQVTGLRNSENKERELFRAMDLEFRALPDIGTRALDIQDDTIVKDETVTIRQQHFALQTRMEELNVQIAKLEVERTRIDESITGLTLEISRTRELLDTHSATVVGKVNEIRRLEASQKTTGADVGVEGLKRQLEEAEGRFAMCEATYLGLQGEVQAKRRLSDTVDDEIRRLLAELENGQRILTERETTFDELQRKWIDAKAFSDASAGVTQDYYALQKTILEKDKQISLLDKARSVVMSGTAGEIEKKAAADEQTIRELENKVREQESELTILRSKLSSLQSDLHA